MKVKVVLLGLVQCFYPLSAAAADVVIRGVVAQLYVLRFDPVQQLLLCCQRMVCCHLVGEERVSQIVHVEVRRPTVLTGLEHATVLECEVVCSVVDQMSGVVVVVIMIV